MEGDTFRRSSYSLPSLGFRILCTIPDEVARIALLMGMPFVIVLEVLFLAVLRSTDRTLQLPEDCVIVVCKRLVIDLKRSWA